MSYILNSLDHADIVKNAMSIINKANGEKVNCEIIETDYSSTVFYKFSNLAYIKLIEPLSKLCVEKGPSKRKISFYIKNGFLTVNLWGINDGKDVTLIFPFSQDSNIEFFLAN